MSYSCKVLKNWIKKRFKTLIEDFIFKFNTNFMWISTIKLGESIFGSIYQIWNRIPNNANKNLILMTINLQIWSF